MFIYLVFTQLKRNFKIVNGIIYNNIDDKLHKNTFEFIRKPSTLVKYETKRTMQEKYVENKQKKEKGCFQDKQFALHCLLNSCYSNYSIIHLQQ